MESDEHSAIGKGNVSRLSVGDIHVARIILNVPSRNLIFSSCLDYLTSWTGPLISPEGYAALRCRPGYRLQSCKVAAVDPQFAARLVTSFNGVPVMADVAKSRCLDSNPDKVPLKVGDIIREARVLSSNLFESAVSVTTAPKMLEEPVLVAGDLKPGQLVTGEITFVSENTIFVKISQYVMGRCPKDQATNVPVAELPPKFQVGKKLKCRVLYIDIRSNSLYLTAKKTLVEDENPLADFTVDAVAGKIVNGVVQKVLAGNPVTLVRFFGGITGQLPTEEFETLNMQSKLKKGALVRCRIVEVNHLSRFLRLSLDLSPKTVVSSSSFAICSEVMQCLGGLRREKSRAVTPSEVVEWLEHHARASIVRRLLPVAKWVDQNVYIFLPRELRSK